MRTDTAIQEDILTEMKWQPILQAARIGVSVKEGIVSLSGTVDTYAQKIAAERAAKKVAGVRAIAEDIQIGVSPSAKKTDAEIAESALNALLLHSAVPHEKIKLKVEEGQVTLEGMVDWDYQRLSATQAIRNLAGVRAVNNLLTITPRLLATDVQAKITAALHRAATIDAEKIKVEIEGSKVILRGVVRSFAEKEDAEEAASCAPGVSKVESLLYVEPQLEFTF
ncbi:MAG TPA: BON domain-containing protein [Flavisolibacter sp.]